MNSNLFTHRLAGMMLAVALNLVPMTVMSASLPPPPAAVEEPFPNDLVDERPSVVGMIWGYSANAVGWTWGVLRDNVFSWITPPSPSSLGAVSKQDANQLFKLLKAAGYKLKEIDTDVGLIPGLYFKFGQTKELSEADFEYLESEVELWEQSHPGMYAALQRKIIKTVMSINSSGDYQVSTLKVKILPLPDVSFIMTPRQTFLGEESSTLMRAIQRVERGVRGLSKADAKELKKP